MRCKRLRRCSFKTLVTAISSYLLFCYFFYLINPVSVKYIFNNSARQLHDTTFRNVRNQESRRGSIPEDILHGRGPPKNSVSCSALFMGNRTELAIAGEHMKSNNPTNVQDENYIDLTQDCQRFRSLRGYISIPLSKEEEEYTIAFTILMHKDVEQVERLLRAIYMPQNNYCIHVDAKVTNVVLLAMNRIAGWFSNVFIPSQLENVHWGHISILKAELNCVKELLKYKWKYYLNLSGQMFPLQTNRNLVKILKLYDGANDIEGKRSWRYWVRQTFRYTYSEWKGGIAINYFLKTASPPHNMTIFKGSHYVAATREFITYAFFSQEGRDLMNWLNDTFAPDEHFMPTLNHNKHLQAPGGYQVDPEEKKFTAHATIWHKFDHQNIWSWKNWQCHGKWMRGVCIPGVGDLPWTFNRPELFINKLYFDFEPLTLDCIEELIFNRTMARAGYPFDPSYYQNLDIVKHQEYVNFN